MGEIFVWLFYVMWCCQLYIRFFILFFYNRLWFVCIVCLMWKCNSTAIQLLAAMVESNKPFQIKSNQQIVAWNAEFCSWEFMGSCQVDWMVSFSRCSCRNWLDHCSHAAPSIELLFQGCCHLLLWWGGELSITSWIVYKFLRLSRCLKVNTSLQLPFSNFRAYGNISLN